MRSAFLFLVMAAASFGLIGLAPSRVEGGHPRYYAGHYYPTYYHRPTYYGPVYRGYYYPAPVYYPTYYPAYYPSYTGSYFAPPAYTTYYYAPAPVVVPPRPMVRGYVSFPGGYVSW